MSILSDAVRPFWLAGLNDVSGRTVKELAGWLCDEDYQIYSAVTSGSFSLTVSDRRALLSAFATEVNRISTASFETLAQLRLTWPSKSVAWPLIQRYYAAFFAAHATLRMLGGGCGTFGRAQTSSVLKVGRAWGVDVPTSLNGGLYRFQYGNSESGFDASCLAGSPHEAFWCLYDSKIVSIRDSLLSGNSHVALTQDQRQVVAVKLGQLHDNLTYLRTSRSAGWLTHVRNAINYDQKFSTWWPYTDRPKYYDRLAVLDADLNSAFDIDLVPQDGEDLARFQATCNFVIALCQENIRDMSQRCSIGKSFLQYGGYAYLQLSDQAGIKSRVLAS